jgi:RNA polymerase sigma factor (sigma-70 family)
MRDSELAASIVDGDPDALAAAYDKYADLLWSYCRSMLSDADHAAEAVLDTFVIAAARMEVLRPLGRLRAWLYAVARSECMRRLRWSRTPAAVDEGPRLRQAAAVLSTGEQRQLRALLSTAFGGLDPDERDVMTMVWHGLDLAEVAVVLGVPRSEVYALFTRARDQLEASVGALLVGWSGQTACAELDAMLSGRDRRLTADLRVRMGRHMEKCPMCSERHRREMRPGLLLSLSMGALLGEAAEARATASRAPAGLWEEVYRMTTGQDPDAIWYRAEDCRHMAFGEDGFPRQILSGRDGLTRAPRFKVAAVGTVAVAATATGLASSGHYNATTGGGANTASSSISSVLPSATSTASVPSVGAPSGGSSHASHSHANPAAARSGSRSRPGSPSSLPAVGGSTVTVSQGAPSGGTSSSAGTTARTGSLAPSTSPSSAPSSGSGGSTGGSGGTTATPGTLSVSTNQIALAVAGSGSFTMTAHGGPVNWSISVPSGLLGNISLSQSSGTLAAGQSVTIKVTVSGLATLNTPLTISPGNEKVTVLVGLL